MCILVLASLMFSCSEVETTEIKQVEEWAEIDSLDSLHSDMRPNENLQMGAIYIDTLIFEEYETEYDYWCARFKLPNEQNIYLVYDEEIANALAGSEFLVSWQMDTFYEAGENEDSYFAEKMISYEIIEENQDFKGYLTDFIKAYSRVSDDLIGNYIHPDEGFYSSYNPGAMCVVDRVQKPKVEKFISWDCVISGEMPKGHFCDEFEGIEEGLYFENIEAKNLPEFASFDEEGDLMFLSLSFKIKTEIVGLVKVQEISQNSFRRLYFFKTEGKWYFWIEDLCDCSA
jgi:hypothetical protein